MTSETPHVSPDAMSQPDDVAESTERLSSEGGVVERTATEDTGEDTTMETGEEEEGSIGRAEGGSPSPAEERPLSSAEEGKPEGVKKKSRLRQGLINFKRKLFPRKKVSKLKESNKHCSQKSKSASNVLTEVEEDQTKMERAMSVDSVYPTEQRTTASDGMKDARSLEAIHLAALQSQLKKRRPRDEESPDTSATDMTQPYGGSSQSLGSMNSLKNEAMEDFFQTNWMTGNTKRPVSPEPKIQDLDMVSGAKLLENKEARQKISVKPKKTRPASRHPRTRTASPQQKSTSFLPQVTEEPQPVEPVLSPARNKAAVTSVKAAEKVTPITDTPEEAPRPVPAVGEDATPEIIPSPVKEVSKEDTPKPKEEPVESKKETETASKTPVKPKTKQRDELRVMQVRRVPSERIGKAVHLRENNGTPESKVKRRMVSSDGTSLEALHSAQLTSMEQPFEWLAARQKKTAETGSKTSLDPKASQEEEQSNVKVSRVPSERKTQDVKLREKSDAPEDKTRRRIASDGGSVEERQSPRPTSMQEPLGQAVVKKEDTSASQKKDDASSSGGNTELSQMFNKLKQKSQKKVKAPVDEKENMVLKMTPKESNVVTSPTKPPLTDTHSNVSKAEDPAKVSAVPKQKTVCVIEKGEPKSSKLEPPPAENTVIRRSSPLLTDRTRRQTLPVSPSQVIVQSPEKEGDVSKVKRTASQRKQTEPATSTPLSSSTGSGLIRAATVVPKKQPSEEAPSNVPPWAAMALKKTSKFEQNMKLKACAEIKSESVKPADSKPDSATEPAASVARSVTDAGSANTSETVLGLNAVTKPTLSNTISSTVSSTTTKTAVSSVTTKPAVSNVTTKPAVLIIPAKPAVSSTTTKPAVLIIPAKPVVSSTTAKPVVSSATTKPAVSNTVTKSAVSTIKPPGGVVKTPGSSTVFAPNLRSKAPTSNVVDTNKNNDEMKSSETILTPDRKENFSGNRKSRVLDMVKNWQNPQVADV